MTPTDTQSKLAFYRAHLETCRLLAQRNNDPDFLAALRDEIEEIERQIARLEAPQS